MEKNLTAFWSFSQKLTFRFFAVYFCLYTLNSVFITIFWDPLVSWTAGHILDIGYEIKIKPNGSGDTTYNYVQGFCTLIISIGSTMIWTLLDRKRPNYEQLLYWVTAYLRYYLATVLIAYGFGKIIQLQFPFPSPMRLIESFGDSSPMGLAWTFMGYSRGFNLFVGLAEALGGFLLFFRRTTTFGTLFSMTVLSNIVAMNFFYDIPVKLFSSHLLLIAVFIAAPDIRRLSSFFFFNRDVPAKSAPALSSKKWVRVVRLIFKTMFITGLLATQAWSSMKREKTYGSTAPKPPLYGIYEVESFEKNRETVPPLATDSVRWDLLVVNRGGRAAVKTMSGNINYYHFNVDTAKKSIRLEEKDTLTYHRSDTGILTLTGRIGIDSMEIRLKKKELQEFTLVNRGFRWISEYPFNR